MPKCENREYRSISPLAADPLRIDYHVQGYATTFNQRYPLTVKNGVQIYEMIAPTAFNNCDMTDVIMQFDHNGRVYARTSNETIKLSVDAHGLLVDAWLNLTESAKQLWEEINARLITKMSFSFIVAKQHFDRETNTRIIDEIKKVFDVSAVSIPANDKTEISAECRTWLEDYLPTPLEERERHDAEKEVKQDADKDTQETEDKKELEEMLDDVRATPEQRKKAIDEILNGAGTIIKRKTNRKEDKKMSELFNKYTVGEMTEREYRNASNTCTELVTSAESTFPMPSEIADKIEKAWESNALLKGAKKSYFKGTLKVPYEASSEDAAWHQENGDSIPQEELVLGVAKLEPMMLKKWVGVTDEACDIGGDFLTNYLYDEILYRINSAICEDIVSSLAIDAAGDAIFATEVEMAGATPTTADLIALEGAVKGEMIDPVYVMNRATYAAIKAAAIAGNYGYDPFNGFPVVIDEHMGGNNGFVTFLDRAGIRVNYANGTDAIQFKVDDLSKMEYDITRFLGRLYVGDGYVRPHGAAVLIEAEDAGDAA